MRDELYTTTNYYHAESETSKQKYYINANNPLQSKGFEEWHPHGESNPGRQLEKLVS